VTSGELLVRIWFSVGGFLLGVVVSETIRSAITHKRPGGNVFRTLFGLLMLAAVVTATIIPVQRAECQSAFNEAFLTALAERSAAGDLDRQVNNDRAEANRQLILAVLSPSPTQEQRIEQLKDYVGKLEQAQRKLDLANSQRAANPLPTIEDCDLISW
jgi:hypothetical protein